MKFWKQACFEGSLEKLPFLDSRDGKKEKNGERWARTLWQSQNPIMKYASKPPVTVDDIYSCFFLNLDQRNAQK